MKEKGESRQRSAKSPSHKAKAGVICHLLQIPRKMFPMTRMKITLVALLFCLGASGDVLETREIFPGGKFSYYATRSLNEKHPNVERAVIVVHGILRNADEYFRSVRRAAETEKVLDHTLVLAPHFKTTEDKLSPNEIAWDSGDWKSGALTVTPKGVSESSFTVLEKLQTLLSDKARFPSLREIVLTGHSAGGQIMSRFSVSNRLTREKGGPKKGLKVRYIISNPSTYIYLSPERAKAGTNEFEAPETSDCEDYDDYPYGLNYPNEFFADLEEEDLISNLQTRDITVFVGQKDTETELLDMSCGAMLQGKNRYERGVTYFRYLQKFFPSALQKIVVAPGIGHDGDLMYNSAEGRGLLFHDQS
jgi:hypothetical protein